MLRPTPPTVSRWTVQGRERDAATLVGGPKSRATTITEPITNRIARLVADLGHVGGWTLFVDDVPQSHVSLNDPAHLEFSYLRMVAAIVDTMPQIGAALHLGGGALTLPR